MSKKYYWAGLSSATKPTGAAIPPGALALETGTGNIYEYDGTATWRQTGSGGAAHVTASPGGIASIRQEAALGATAVTFTWPSPGVSAVKLQIASEAAGTAELAATVAYCIDPPSQAVRDAWLTAGDSISTDANMHLAFANVENDPLVFTSPITTLGLKRLWGSQALTAIAIGVEV